MAFNCAMSLSFSEDVAFQVDKWSVIISVNEWTNSTKKGNSETFGYQGFMLQDTVGNDPKFYLKLPSDKKKWPTNKYLINNL